MKKTFLFFVIFMIFGVLAAQEEENVQSVEQNEPAAAAEEVKENDEAVPAEAPAAENQESEAKEAPREEEKVPEITGQPNEPEQKGTKNETPAQPEEAPAEDTKEKPVQPETVETPAELERAETYACEPVIKDEKPSKVFYQPSVGFGIGASIFSLRVNNDIDFLLKHTKDGTNVYMGLEIDFRYSPYLDDHSIYEIPVQLNFLFDFLVKHRNIKRLAMWFSAGVDLAFGYLFYYDYDDDWDDDKDRDSRFKVVPAWGLGVTMLFKNDVTLKLGFDSFYGKYPDLICAAGYRF